MAFLGRCGPHARLGRPLGLVAALLSTAAPLVVGAGSGAAAGAARAGAAAGVTEFPRPRLVRRAAQAAAAADSAWDLGRLAGEEAASETSNSGRSDATVAKVSADPAAAAAAAVATALPAAPAHKSFANVDSFMTALGSQIKQAWLLQGDPLLLVVGTEPYLVSPDKAKPVLPPAEVAKEISGVVGAKPETMAQEAQSKGGVSLTVWLSDFDALLNLSDSMDWDLVSQLQEKGKLRGFINGHEHTEDTIGRLGHTELLKLAWSTIWLRGGMGREGVLKLTVEAARKEATDVAARGGGHRGGASATMLEGAAGGDDQAHSASVIAPTDLDRLRTALRAAPPDGFPSAMQDY